MDFNSNLSLGRMPLSSNNESAKASLHSIDGGDFHVYQGNEEGTLSRHVASVASEVLGGLPQQSSRKLTERFAQLDRNVRKGIECYQRAAEFGRSKTLYLIGLYHQHSLRNFPQDDAKAFSFYKKSAEFGDRRAKYFLAECYKERGGTAPDPVEAERLFAEAKKLGFTEKDRKSVLEDVERIRADKPAQMDAPSPLPFSTTLGHDISKPTHGKIAETSL